MCGWQRCCPVTGVELCSPWGGSCRTGRGWDSASHHTSDSVLCKVLCCPQTSASISFHPLAHPPTLSCLASCSGFAQVPSAVNAGLQAQHRALLLQHQASLGSILQHKLQKSLAAAGVPFLLSLFVFQKPFCIVDLNYCPRWKCLGLVMSK